MTGRKKGKDVTMVREAINLLENIIKCIIFST